MKILIFFILFLFLNIPVFADTPKNNTEFNDAVILYENGQIEDALEKTRQFLIENPDHHEAKSNECSFLIELKRFTEAENCLVNIVSNNTTDVVNLNSLGILYFSHGEYLSAKTQFAIAHNLEPNDIFIHSNLLSAKVMSGENSEEILYDLENLISKDETLINLYVTSAKILNDQNQPDKARIFLEKAYALDKKQINVLTQFGISYALEEDFQNAEKYLLIGYEINPQDSGILKNLSSIYYDQGLRNSKLGDETNNAQYYQKAIEFYNLALKYNPDNEGVKNGITYSYEKIYGLLNLQLSIVISIIFTSGIVLFVSLYMVNRKKLNLIKSDSTIKNQKKKIDDLIFNKLLCVFITGILTIPLILIIISFTYAIQISDGIDMSNWASTVAEVIIGITVAAIILSYELSRQDKIDLKQNEIAELANTSNKLIRNTKEMVIEIKRLEKNQDKLMKEQQELIKNENERIHKRKVRFGGIIHRNLLFIKEHHVTLEEWIKNYSENPSVEQKSDIIRNAKNLGHNVLFYVESILELVPKIESDFNDPVLGTNLINYCKKYPDLFLSIEVEHHWTSEGLKGLLLQINTMQKYLERDIPRISEESK